MSRALVPRAFLLFAVCLVVASDSSGFELTGQIAAEGRVFFQEALGSEQQDANVSLAFQPELYHDWQRGRVALTVTPFLRLDQGDEERTHFDVREAFVLYAGDSFELRAGLRQVFWGVAESQHLVDIVNQTDLVENTDGEDKLGQPMVELTLLPSLGTVELSLLPGFRERTFPGVEGRFGGFEVGDPLFESDAAEHRLDWAARWSHYVGPVDFGLSHFQGNSREPLFVVRGTQQKPEIRPYHPVIDQSGLEMQATLGGWLWKLEAIRRSGFSAPSPGAKQGVGGGSAGSTFTAAVAGFEYTTVGIAGSVADVGWIAEYHIDDRGHRATTPFEDDLFLGARLVLNDVQSTECLGGVIVDREDGTVLSNLEASRRFGDRWRLYLEYRGFAGVEPGDPLYPFRRDDYVQIELARFF